jgi:hypothetical protein
METTERTVEGSEELRQTSDSKASEEKRERERERVLLI